VTIDPDDVHDDAEMGEDAPQAPLVGELDDETDGEEEDEESEGEGEIVGVWTRLSARLCSQASSGSLGPTLVGYAERAWQRCGREILTGQLSRDAWMGVVTPVQL
tara:strand:+ start:463 stop:777 length:315 start_codon:yes stop_codon:yes gene_type:complete